jgi:hypothetical protein
MLLRRENFWKTLGWLSLFGVLSFIPYALWFVAAWHQGGQEFLDLMYEENIGRMTNTMSYDSCVEPWYYNFLTILSGWIPYTLLALLALFLTGCLKNIGNLWNKSKISAAWKSRNNSPLDLFALTSIVTIFVFYCIPQSKRSVYLMPIYPFMGYFIARMMMWMSEWRTKPLNIFNGTLATLSILLFVAFVALKFVDVPDTMFHGRHALQNQMTVEALSGISQWWQLLIVVITTAIGVLWWVYRKRVCRGVMAVAATLVLVLGIYLSLDGVYNPTVLNVKSIKEECASINLAAPADKGKLYEYMEVGVKAKGDPAHFFEVNFYLGNRIGSFVSTPVILIEAIVSLIIGIVVGVMIKGGAAKVTEQVYDSNMTPIGTVPAFSEFAQVGLGVAFGVLAAIVVFSIAYGVTKLIQRSKT